MIRIRQGVQSILAVGVVGIVTAGCSVPTIPLLRSQPTLENVVLNLQVAPGDVPGTYAISGTTDLPEGTELTVLAIRHLRLNKAPLVATQPAPTYSILAYEPITVEGDRWQTQLSLWQVAADGTFQETWQRQDADLQLAVTPEDTVLFLATLAPLDDLEAIEQFLAAENQRFANRFVQTTSEGNRYLIAGKALEVGLPSGKTTAIAEREEDINGGWGNRFRELPDLPNKRQLEFPDNRQTNAPATQGEFLY